ncbi:MAG: ribosome-associated translation inhibitor RaiA [Planctomycetota bacterium]|nr:MAG: ribosome-associated translation inhibitor RaiA [Planctomycetota bacterium]
MPPLREREGIMLAMKITGIHYSVSAKVREYALEKFANHDRFHPDIQFCQMTIREAANFGYRVDVSMGLPHHKEVVAHCEAETVYAGIDGVVDKAAKQLVKIHEKEQAKHRNQSDRHRIRA